MSNTDGTCEYVLDPDDPETWGGEEGDRCHVDEEVLNEDGVWTCPHAADGEDGLCIFHLPVEKKDDEQVVAAFLDVLDAATSDDTESRGLQFIGARFGAFDLSESPPEVTNEDRKLVMDYAEITGPLDWSQVKIDVSSIELRAIRCLADANFRDAVFGGDTIFRFAVFGGDTIFKDTEFRGDSIFRFADFRGDITFRFAEFGGETNFRSAEFGGDTDLLHAELEGATIFKDAVFRGDSIFRFAVFRGDSIFRSAEFRGAIDFWNADFGGAIDFRRADFGGDTNFNSAEFGDTYFRYAEFEGDATFRDVEFGGETKFNSAEFGEDVDFRDAEFGGDETQFVGADLTDATFTETGLQRANFESALLSRATLFEADLRGAKLAGAVLGDVRINEDTKFLGHPSDDSDSSPHTFSAIRSRPTCAYDPDYQEDSEHEDVDKAKSLYRAFEELGGKHARPRLQARSFVRRQDLQKQDYWDDATADDASLEERFIAGARWSRARVARATLLYGESPWRVTGWSLGIILSFALLYPLGGWMRAEGANEPLSYSQIPVSLLSEPLGWLGGFLNVLADSLYYSTLTYTALGFGDFQPESFGRLLTTVETGFGAVMLALLVFILGRRAAR